MARLTYQLLYTHGYRNISVLHEGIPGWIQQGYPTEGPAAGYVPNHRRDYVVSLSPQQP
jgi:3-mercaptopyruvate sulfurtransferase SseA